ncbi:hypothetical protein [Amycolatopsis suaedae]|uniref:Uncharacterized protein n=1 Tax=Amycolatopsis suaedae TaxID=2510978 RepID=A0A4V2EMA9_9PSEU|nr:hypothetical protein [Amycolatopsis suaedae]RZQ64425.1 hypothetical protein EWH70_10730 [Amycolatopsis suaedae]
MNAAMRYKEIVALARGAEQQLRAWEVARVDELEAMIAAARNDVAEAAQQETKTQERVDRWWRMAVDNVSRLSWLEAGAGPEPNATARGAYLERYLEEVRPAYQELVQSILKLGWRAK